MHIVEKNKKYEIKSGFFPLYFLQDPGVFEEQNSKNTILKNEIGRRCLQYIKILLKNKQLDEEKKNC